jgi:outer membrane immunogenic protein
MLRKFGWALAAAVSIASFGPATAADLPVKARPVVVPLYNWTGCYVGLSAGGKGVGLDETVHTTAGIFPAAALDLGRREAETWVAGGQAGCNYQAGRWVFGVEVDGHAQRWSQSDILAGVILAPFVNGSTFELHSDWQASARGRLGYAIDRTLFYGTAGAAFTEVRARTNWLPNPPLPGVIVDQSRTLVGVTVGAGVEHAVTDNFTLGLEGRYSWYERQRFDLGLVPVGVTGVIAVFPVFAPGYRDVKLETGEIIFKANWKFGPTAVVAKY